MHKPLKATLNSQNKIEIRKDSYPDGFFSSKMESISIGIIENDELELVSKEDVETLTKHARHTVIHFCNRGIKAQSKVILLEDIPFSLLDIQGTDEMAIIETISVGPAVNDSCIEILKVESYNHENENIYYHNKGNELVLGFKVIDRITAYNPTLTANGKKILS